MVKKGGREEKVEGEKVKEEKGENWQQKRRKSISGVHCGRVARRREVLWNWKLERRGAEKWDGQNWDALLQRLSLLDC